MPALYRTYRPQKFSEVIGQEHVKATLRNAVVAGTFSHAYLFTGMRGTGKTTVARIFARAINCLHPKDGEPCNECAVCKQFMDGTSLDLNEIDAASHTGVENVREIIENLKFTPAQAKYRVFIVDEVHMLSKPAFNALLKTLEEPPSHAVFILATTEVHKVPATVVSRTQRYDFRKVENSLLLGHLKGIAAREKINIDVASLDLIVAAAEGSVRDALSILDKLSTYGDITVGVTEQLLGTTNVETAQKFLSLLAAKDAVGSLEFLEQQFSAGTDPVQFNKDFLEYCRKLLMAMNGAQLGFSLSETQQATLREQVAAMTINQLLHIIRLFLRANKDFQSSPSADLPMEVSAAEACLAALATVSSPAVAQKVPEKSERKFEPLPEKSPEPARPASAASPANSATLDQFMAAWPSILDGAREQASTLLTVLKTVFVRSVENGEVSIVCSYDFHRETLANAKNRAILVSLFDLHFGPGLFPRFSVEKQTQATLVDASSAAAEIFG
jgi:DNA polymerase-3 subunit gamma/tau